MLDAVEDDDPDPVFDEFVAGLASPAGETPLASDPAQGSSEDKSGAAVVPAKVEGAPAVAATQAKPETPVVPVVPATATPPAGTQQPGATGEQQVAVVPTESAKDPAALYTQWRGNMEAGLASHFAVDDKMREEFEADPYTAIPKVAAKIFLSAVEASARAVENALPQLLEQHLRGRDANTAAEEKFFGAWPALREHKSEIEQVGVAYRAVNPKCTQEDFIRDVGALVAVRKGIPLVGPGVTAQVETPPKRTPIPPATPVGVASPGGVSPVVPNIWADLATALDDD